MAAPSFGVPMMEGIFGSPFGAVDLARTARHSWLLLWTPIQPILRGGLGPAADRQQT